MLPRTKNERMGAVSGFGEIHQDTVALMLRRVRDDNPQMIAANRWAPNKRDPYVHVGLACLEGCFRALNRLNFQRNPFDFILVLNHLAKHIFGLKWE